LGGWFLGMVFWVILRWLVGGGGGGGGADEGPRKRLKQGGREGTHGTQGLTGGEGGPWTKKIEKGTEGGLLDGVLKKKWGGGGIGSLY